MVKREDIIGKDATIDDEEMAEILDYITDLIENMDKYNLSLDDFKELVDQRILSERFGKQKKQKQKRYKYRAGKRFRWYNFRY